MPIPKSDKEVLTDIPQWLLKKMAKIEPSPIAGSDGEGVYYIGRFSDTWAPEDLRGREFYYAHAKLVLSPGDVSKVADPLFAPFATELCYAFVLSICGPRGDNIIWVNCLDPQFEGTGTGCFTRAVAGGFSYDFCIYAGLYAPAMFIFSSAPANNADFANVAAYSKPCPVAQQTPSLSGKPETSGRLLLRAVGCDDASNRVRYVRYTSEDRNPTTYNITALGIGGIRSSNEIVIFARYPLASSITKSANDYYYFIYTIGLNYQ